MVRHVRPSVVRSFFKVFLFFFVLFAIYEFLATNVYMTHSSKDVAEVELRDTKKPPVPLLPLQKQGSVIISSKPTETTVNKVLVISSMPRSGSSMIGELLTTYDNNYSYIYEPDQYIESNKCLQNDSCTFQFFRDLLECKEDVFFYDWFVKKRFFFKNYNAEAFACYERQEKQEDYLQCVNKINILRDCKETSLQIIKNIRTRLSITKKLLNLKNLNLKVIHLYRDPRGSLASISKFKWHTPPEERCQGLQDDLTVYGRLKLKYPDRIYSFSYENFCINPWQETKNIFLFLFGNATLPEESEKYILKHLFPDKPSKGVMSTTKDSRFQFQSWRWTISKTNLKKFEEIPQCNKSIELMGHRLFGSLNKTRNKKISLFKDS